MASSEEFSSLREQALRRMRQMHSSAQSSEPQVNSSPVSEPISHPDPPGIHNEHNNESRRKQASPFSEFLGSLAGIGNQNNQKSLFDELNIDEEKAVIGILIYVLYKNGADIKLMLALGYLLI